MDFILGLTMLILAGTVVYLIYRFFSGMKMVATDDMYQQRGITVMYKDGTIAIGKYTYPVSKITSLTRITNHTGNRKSHYIKIEVDDMRKPVHKVAVVGTEHQSEQFMQRICVAVRKAGGPDFY